LACETNFKGEYIAKELAQEQTVANLFAFGDRLKRTHDILKKHKKRANKVNVVCVSDLHGQLPATAEGDLLIVAGDICPTTNHGSVYQADFINSRFRDWLKAQPAKKKVFIGGNHDFVLQQRKWWHKKYPATYLQDSGTEYKGIKIWGTPWSVSYGPWAFMAADAELSNKWDLIPDDTDILVVHGPPHGVGDKVPSRSSDEENWPKPEHAGSKTLLKRILEVKPKLVVCGHIHCDRGIHWLGDIPVVNAAVLDDRYHMANFPIVMHYPTKEAA
jgi:Icc-related predicted phosphoesterase